MNPRLVGCLFGSILAAAFAAGLTLAAGWGPLTALAVYSLWGSLVLVASIAVATVGATPAAEPVRATRTAQPVRATVRAPEPRTD